MCVCTSSVYTPWLTIYDWQFKDIELTKHVVESPVPNQTDVWKLLFDGSCTKDGVEARVVLISPKKENNTQSWKLDFEVTNNVVEYEAFLLGLQLAKSIKVQNLSVFTDSKLIVKQVRNLCQTKHPRIRSYWNEIWDSVENFFNAFNLTYIPRD